MSCYFKDGIKYHTKDLTPEQKQFKERLGKNDEVFEWVVENKKKGEVK